MYCIAVHLAAAGDSETESAESWRNAVAVCPQGIEEAAASFSSEPNKNRNNWHEHAPVHGNIVTERTGAEARAVNESSAALEAGAHRHHAPRGVI